MWAAHSSLGVGFSGHVRLFKNQDSNLATKRRTTNDERLATHSARKACTGSTPAALRDGTYVASHAIPRIAPVAAA